jgi:ketosteroid isomerase-like protein
MFHFSYPRSTSSRKLAERGVLLMEIATEIIALERDALDRWGRGDPEGLLEIYADDITYFDPVAPARVDGLDAMKAWYAPIAGKVRVARYDMIGALVRRYGEIAVLSYQLINYGSDDIVLTRWNTTSVYQRTDIGWRIVHSHFSYTQPQLKQPVLE